MSEQNIEGWVVVFSSGTDYEAEMVRDRLDDSGLNAVVLTHRDHAFNLNVGKLSLVRVLVEPHQESQALAILQSQPFTDEELASAAMKANPISENQSDHGDDENPVD